MRVNNFKRVGKDRNLRVRHKIGQQKFEEMKAAQNGVCAICGGPATQRDFHVDHNHTTGQIRGLLCSRCNVGIGMFRDDPELVKRAVAYLESFSQESTNA